MTGYGTGSAPCVGGAVSVELRAVNHKYCDIKLRIPRDFNPLEPRLLSAIRAKLHRGHVEVSVRWSELPAGREHVRADLPRGKAIAEAYRGLAASLGLTPVIDLSLLAHHNVVEAEETARAPEDLWPGLSAALKVALQACVGMREVEGAALQAALQTHLQRLSNWRAAAAELAPRAQAENCARFKERLHALCADVGADPTRVAQEAAFLAERIDVTEELARLESHLAQVTTTLADGEGVGRKLDFLCQELHREINTVGSKAQHVELTRLVVDFKAELDKLREQVQNVE